MDEIGQIRRNWVQSGQNRLKWTRMGQKSLKKGLEVSKMVPNGPKMDEKKSKMV